MKAYAPAAVISKCALPLGLEELSKQWCQTEWCHLSPRYKGQMTPNTVAAFSAATPDMTSDASLDAPEAANQGGGRRSQKNILEQDASYEI